VDCEETRDTALRFAYVYVRVRGAETLPKKKALLPKKNRKIVLFYITRIKGLEEYNSL
jgi:hypothetical protein